MTLQEFLKDKFKYDNYGQFIWLVQPNGNHQKIADLRGWGAIQNLFKDKSGKIDFKKAEKFQDELGEWVATALNEKLGTFVPPSEEKKEIKPINGKTMNDKLIISKYKELVKLHQRFLTYKSKDMIKLENELSLLQEKDKPIEGEKVVCDNCGDTMVSVDSNRYWQCFNCGNTRAK